MPRKAVNKDVYEDISSSSPSKKSVLKDDYAEKAIKKIDKIIKLIAFVIAIGTMLLFLAVAAVVFMLDSSFLLIAIGILVLGLIFSLISLFLIYGLGHIITQNNELLKRK